MENLRQKPVRRAAYQDIGLLLGPGVFLLMMILGQEQLFMDALAWRVAAIGLWMAIWWMTEAIPVPVTAFLPIVLFAPMGISSMKAATAPYASPIIYLYLGGFLLALAVERWHLHRRIALFILSITGTQGHKLIGGFMLTGALLSMWMTNTATTIMLLPIALSLLAVIGEKLPDQNEKNQQNFQTAMLLGLAYSATIGGLATLVGTPPNALLAAFLQENYQMEISFARWMMVGIPVSFIMLPLAWVLLTRLLYPFDIPENKETHAHLLSLRNALGGMSRAEKRIAMVFGLVITGWLLRKPVAEVFALEGLSDSGIAILGALLLFIIPSGDKQQQKLLSWEQTSQLPWGVMILFGGGLSLASAIVDSGLAQWLGESVSSVSVFGFFFLTLSVVALVIFLTELTSNLATTAALLPVIAALAIEVGVSPFLLCVPITLAASCAFMLPVATPPNAIVFSSGLITIPQMAKAGALLNLASVAFLTCLCIWWVPIVFG